MRSEKTRYSDLMPRNLCLSPCACILYGATVMLTTFAALATLSAPASNKPIAMHPDYPRYFLLRGRPTILLTSAEHYGAVLNEDFDYLPSLNALQASGFNYT